MSAPILICSDLDRTVLPNGHQPESPEARPLLHALARRPEVTLAYVSGRDLGLLRAAVAEYDLPLPAYAAGDVGTSLYRVEHGRWEPVAAWTKTIAPDWGGRTSETLAPLFRDIPDLALQPEDRQGAFKLSYFARPDLDRAAVFHEMHRRLEAEGLRAAIIWSVDETRDEGLVDVVPAGATKLHAVRFLIGHLGVPEERAVYSGDSGNDMPVLTSGLQATLVANATDDVREEAQEVLAATGGGETLYLARGDFLGMNGNYAAGVLEGVAHFFPEARAWMST